MDAVCTSQILWKKNLNTHTAVLWGIKHGGAHLPFSSTYSFIPGLPWDFLTPLFLLSPLPSQDAAFLHFHPLLFLLCLSESIPRIAIILFHSFFSPPFSCTPHHPLYFPPCGVLFLMNCRLTTVCILPSDASSSSSSENREIQYDAVIIAWAGWERRKERMRQTKRDK